MKKSKVLQVCVGFVLCVLQVVVTSALDCPDKASGGTRCTISVEKLLDRAIQHAELIYRVSEESSMLFEEMFIPLSATGQYRGPVCAPRSVPIFTSRTEIQQISDKWLLHTVLIMVQFWIDPLVDLQASLDRYDNAPSVLLNRTKWMSTKLMSLEQGVQVLIKKILGEGSLLLEGPENTGELFVSADMIESVRRDYGILYCFRKDAHKMETFLKLLKCRHTDKLNCSIF